MSIATHGSGSNPNESVQNDLAVGGDVTIGDDATIGGDAIVGGNVKITGAVIATGVTALILDGSGKALLATGTTVPADAGTLYAKGCLFIDTDVATGTSGLYVNVGTAASCSFKLVTNAS